MTDKMAHDRSNSFSQPEGRTRGAGQKLFATKGFSLVELLVALGILVVISVIAIPNITRLRAIYRLDSAGHTVASLLQEARLQAVRTNAPAYAVFNNGATNMVFVNSDGSANYVNGNPEVAVSSSLTMTPVQPSPNHDQLDAYLGVSGAGGSPKVQTNQVIGFNARGLPCVQGATASICNQQDASGALPVFEWFISDGNGGFEAVTVTAAGRTKSWRLTQQGNGNLSCGYQACWQ